MCFQLSIAISMEEIFNVIHLRVVILSGLLAKELIPAFEKWKKEAEIDGHILLNSCFLVPLKKTRGLFSAYMTTIGRVCLYK